MNEHDFAKHLNYVSTANIILSGLAVNIFSTHGLVYWFVFLNMYVSFMGLTYRLYYQPNHHHDDEETNYKEGR